MNTAFWIKKYFIGRYKLFSMVKRSLCRIMEIEQNIKDNCTLCIQLVFEVGTWFALELEKVCFEVKGKIRFAVNYLYVGKRTFWIKFSFSISFST